MTISRASSVNTSVSGTPEGSWTVRNFVTNTAPSTSAQPLFTAGFDEFNAVADTTYYFKGQIVADTDFNGTAIGVSLSFGGTAGLAAISYGFVGHTSDASTSARFGRSITSSATQVTPTNSSDATMFATVEGTLRVSASGTIIPRVGPNTGGASTVVPAQGSWFQFLALGVFTQFTFGENTWS